MRRSAAEPAAKTRRYLVAHPFFVKKEQGAARRCLPKRPFQGGFTLVELLLVLVILALIGGLVLPGIIGKAEGAKVKAASSQIDRLSMAVESYYLDTGTTPESLDQLVEGGGGVAGWNGPYVSTEFRPDPWGNRYVVSIGLIETSPGVVNELGQPKAAVWVLSAGPNRTIDTPYLQPVTAATVGGDDIAFRIQ